MIKIAVIGAGLSGLIFAHLLQDYADITLFEKACGVGGRMLTRRAEPYFLITEHNILQRAQNAFRILFRL